MGMTPVMMTCNDIGMAIDYLLSLRNLKECMVYLYGRGDSGVAALYRGLIDDRVAGVILEDAPSSHLEGAPIIGILRAFDMPQAVGLMAPRPVALINPCHNYWAWPTRVYERLGCRERISITDDFRKAFQSVFASPPVISEACRQEQVNEAKDKTFVE
jgi:hypothetical protein